MMNMLKRSVMMQHGSITKSFLKGETNGFILNTIIFFAKTEQNSDIRLHSWAILTRDIKALIDSD